MGEGIMEAMGERQREGEGNETWKEKREIGGKRET